MGTALSVECNWLFLEGFAAVLMMLMLISSDRVETDVKQEEYKRVKAPSFTDLNSFLVEVEFYKV